MKRAVVVLLLLIANAIVSSSKINMPDPAPAPRQEYSLGLLSIVDGAGASEHGRLGCAATGRLAWSLAPAGEGPACRRGDDARAPAPLFDVRL